MRFAEALMHVDSHYVRLLLSDNHARSLPSGNLLRHKFGRNWLQSAVNCEFNCFVFTTAGIGTVSPNAAEIVEMMSTAGVRIGGCCAEDTIGACCEVGGRTCAGLKTSNLCDVRTSYNRCGTALSIFFVMCAHHTCAKLLNYYFHKSL